MMTVTAERSLLLHCHPNRNGAFQNTKWHINFIVGGRQATKSNRQQRSNAREMARSTPKLHNLCGGQSSPSPSPKKTTGCTPTPGPTRWSLIT
jgi:hypothetical protein